VGEYADDQISRDMKRMFGVDYEGGEKTSKPKSKKVKCPRCGKWLKPTGINDHIRDFHNKKEIYENS
jgi:hypothetical protein